MATFYVPANINYYVKAYDPMIVFDVASNIVNVSVLAAHIGPLNLTLTRNPIITVPIHLVTPTKQATSLYCPVV